MLGGCSNFIAYKITSPSTIEMSGSVANHITEVDLCDEELQCIKGQKIKESDVDTTKLSFDFKINGNHKTWLFKQKQTEIDYSPAADKPLILIFSGYSQPSGILFIHQQWLQHISGSEVIVIQSANNSEQFKFGLDFVSPVVSYINKRRPKKIHLIGFSMGAVAAQAVSEKVENSHLHLIAPMTSFENSTLALWKILHKEKFYSALISQQTVEDAVQLIYRKSSIDAQEIDLVNRLKSSTVPTYVYTSSDDRVTLASDWNEVHIKQLEINKYHNLNHLEMVGLVHTPLLKDFVSNLLGKDILETDFDTLGLLCDITDNKCLSSI